MSTEQSLGFEVDGRADIYSLGVIALEMVTGKLETYGFAMQPSAMGLLEEEARYRSVAEMRRDLVPAMAACPPSLRGDSVQRLSGKRR